MRKPVRNHLGNQVLRTSVAKQRLRGPPRLQRIFELTPSRWPNGAPVRYGTAAATRSVSGSHFPEILASGLRRPSTSPGTALRSSNSRKAFARACLPCRSASNHFRPRSGTSPPQPPAPPARRPRRRTAAPHTRCARGSGARGSRTLVTPPAAYGSTWWNSRKALSRHRPSAPANAQRPASRRHTARRTAAGMWRERDARAWTRAGALSPRSAGVRAVRPAG